MPGANTLAYWCAMSVTNEKGFMALSAEIEYLSLDPTVCLNQEPKPTYRSVSSDLLKAYVIKLSTAVIYKMFVIRYSVCLWQVFPG